MYSFIVWGYLEAKAHVRLKEGTFILAMRRILHSMS